MGTLAHGWGVRGLRGYLGGCGVGEADGVLEVVVDRPERVRLERRVRQNLSRAYRFIIARGCYFVPKTAMFFRTTPASSRKINKPIPR